MARKLCKEMLAEAVRIHLVCLAVVGFQVGVCLVKMIQVRIPAGRFL